jgi:hypothetical protein
MTTAVLLASQPVVFPDGTMQYAFRDFLIKLDNFVDDGATTATWGSVTGTLSAQTDLQAALDTKPENASNETISGDWTFTGSVDLSSAVITGTERYTVDGGDAATSTFFRSVDGVDATNTLPYSLFNSLDGGAANG